MWAAAPEVILLGNHWSKPPALALALALALARHEDNHLAELSHNRGPGKEHGAAEEN